MISLKLKTCTNFVALNLLNLLLIIGTIFIYTYFLVFHDFIIVVEILNRNINYYNKIIND